MTDTCSIDPVERDIDAYLTRVDREEKRALHDEKQKRERVMASLDKMTPAGVYSTAEIALEILMDWDKGDRDEFLDSMGYSPSE